MIKWKASAVGCLWGGVPRNDLHAVRPGTSHELRAGDRVGPAAACVGRGSRCLSASFAIACGGSYVWIG